MSTDNMMVWGGHGFVGSNFIKHSINGGFNTTLRDDTRAHDSHNVINFVSTTDNYNVLNGDVHIDIDTNLRYLASTLDSWRKDTDAVNGCYNFISSWFVYGDYNAKRIPRGIAEWRPSRNLKGFYSITKKAAECLVIDFCNQYDLNYRILRLGSVIGNDPNASEKKNIMTHWIRQIKQNKDIMIFDKNGLYYRDFISPKHCVEAIDCVLKDPQTLKRVINIGNGKPPYSVIDALEYVHRTCDSQSKIYFTTQKKIKSFYFDVRELMLSNYTPAQYRGPTTYIDMFTDVLV